MFLNVFPFAPTFQHSRLGKKFGDLVCSDSRFEVVGEVNMRLLQACGKFTVGIYLYSTHIYRQKIFVALWL